MNEFKAKLYEDYKQYNKKIKNINVSGNKFPPYYKMYDRDKQYIGWINMKYEKIQNKYLKGVSTFVITRDGNVIVELRSKECNLTPEKRDLCSGHVDEEERSDNAAYRELEEELGIKKEQRDVFVRNEGEIPLTFGKNRKFFIQFNTVIGDFQIDEIRKNIQEKEVDDVIAIPIQQCFELIRNGETKFPYKGKEEEFEKVFRSVMQVYQSYKKEIDMGEK